VPSTTTYQPSALATELYALTRLKAIGLDAPEAIVLALKSHLGLSDPTSDTRVFISYAWSDGKKIAEALREDLKRRDISAWMDQRDLTAGSDVQEEIHAKIEDRGVLLLVESPEARKSRWVLEEIVWARASRVPIVVVGTEERIGLPDAADATYIRWGAGDAVLNKVEELVRWQRSRRSVFVQRVRTAVQVSARELGFKVSGSNGGLRVCGADCVHVDGLPRTPDGLELMAVAERAEAVKADRGLLVAGVLPFPQPTRKLVSKLGGTTTPPVEACPLPDVATALARSQKGSLPRVFLSAAMPEPDPAIDPAVSNERMYSFIAAFVGAVLSGKGSIVFGGHPTITPVVHRVVKEAGLPAALHLHQLLRFKGMTPPEVDDREVFADVTWHGIQNPPTIQDGIGDELGLMRDAMVQSADAAVFLGGKRQGLGGRPGILDELERFRAAHPNGRAHLVGFLGGATEELIHNRDPNDANIVVHTSLDIDLVVAMILTDLGR
jgi:hypothetical protein